MGTPKTRSRLGAVAATAALGLLPALLPATSQAAPTNVPASAANAVEQAVPTIRTPRYRATITRTRHGIPHITAKTWGSLGFGSGYAAAETNICTLADVMLTARGQRSRWLGPEGRYDDQVSMSGTNLQADVLVTDLHDRKVVEKLLADPVAGPGARARAMVEGYAAGLNHYLRSIGGSGNIPDDACRGAAYIKPNATATDIWYGVYLANLLASSGHFLQQIVEADPPTLEELGLPQIPGLPQLPAVPQLPVLTRFAPVPDELPSREALVEGLGGKLPFGSNATAVGRASSSTGRGMVLGNPHFPWRNRYRFSQQHLTIPGSYDVAGASLIGSPVVNIGWNKDVAWSHTVSTAYRFTPYEYKTVLTPTTYLSADGLVRKLERRVVEVVARQPDGSMKTVTEDLYRTPEGYVVEDASLLMGWSPVSFFAIRDANAEQLRTIDTFLDMGRAKNVRDLLARQDAGGGMPWVNTIAADRAGTVLYADHSVVPNVPDDLANLCMTPIGRVTNQVAGLPVLDGTLAGSVCKWRTDTDSARPGVFGPDSLPATFRSDWVMNANDSYWLPNPRQRLEGYAGIIGCERCERTLRSRMVYRYVLDRLRVGKVTPAALRGFQHQNRVLGAEVMGADNDLVDVCEAAEGGNACAVLARWDRRSDPDSRGTHIFEAFVERLPAPGLLPSRSIWKVPFDPGDPVHTPRDLDETHPQVIAAMRDAIADLRDKGVPMDATWGSLQVAGDRGAPAYPLGGGNGDQAGNANALGSHDPVQNKDHLKPVTYGSSHIQAVSFLDGGRLDARTVLTYGQSEDPSSPWSHDQTRLFSQQKWVTFPWTPEQIRRQQVSRTTVSGG